MDGKSFFDETREGVTEVTVADHAGKDFEPIGFICHVERSAGEVISYSDFKKAGSVKKAKMLIEHGEVYIEYRYANRKEYRRFFK